ncbi:MAG: magnesium transporter CorA family protein [Gammaproteobacteria bacterium]|nr:magnesium transporter CorA family protein [Gammaproteobacteria bacterium]
MIIAYLIGKESSPKVIDDKNYACLSEAIWVDILTPTTEEFMWIESVLGVYLPTRAAMLEIEISSRLYEINQILYMTAILVAGATTGEPKGDSVTFILRESQLITLRYVEPSSFTLLAKEIKQSTMQHYSSAMLLVYLLELTIDRLADNLEMIAANLDQFSKSIFHRSHVPNTAPSLNYTELMQHIGHHAELNSQVRESLLSLNRLISFFNQTANLRLDQIYLMRLSTLNKDIVSLSDYTTFMTSKINFLLDATLGMVNIEQNNIIKIFSVAAVIFLPPTLIASIYGMNFQIMPELSWRYGYLLALGLMVFSAIFPYHFFKKRKWL